jgi:NADH:ubiquinone oxidoreductase subunit 5 (subunit L)/multisubunit Na+/H+ antiporter MnhA subunit
MVFNTLDYNSIFSMAHKMSEETIIIWNTEIHAYTLIGILLFIGAVGKSA